MGTINVAEKVSESVDFIRKQVAFAPRVSITLGTGMYSLIDMVERSVKIAYSDIPFFPLSTVDSHAGYLVFGQLQGVDVVLVAGRFHYYEGYSMEEVTYYIHVLKELGVELSILTCAAGGLNAHYKEGQLVIINDHINLFSEHPLRGMNDESLGPRFPDLLHAYSKKLISECVEISLKLELDLKEGVYLGWQGPSLETPAEYKMANLLGADLVGMSTIPEVITNKYREIETLAFAIVSNVCYPTSAIKETTVDDVIKVVNENAKKLQHLILGFLSNHFKIG